jgi:hypothetical protein
MGAMRYTILSLLLAVPVFAAPTPSKTVKKARPSPAASEEADRRMARGAAGVKTASGAEDLKDAAAEFEAAATAAPDLADAYYNAGVTYAKAGEHAAAARNLKRYVELSPKAADVKAAKSLLAEQEFMIEKAAKAARGPDLAALAGDWVQREGLVWYSKTDVIDGALRLRTIAYDEPGGARQTASEGHWGHYRFKWDGSAFKGVYIEGSQGHACAGRESPATAVFSADRREMTVTMTKQYDHPAPGNVVDPRECVLAPKPEYRFTLTRR